MRESQIRKYKEPLCLRKLKEDSIDIVNNIVDNIKDEVGIEDKRSSENVNIGKPDERVDFFLQPKKDNIEPREDKADSTYEMMSSDPSLPDANRYDKGTTPTVSFNTEMNKDENISISKTGKSHNDSIKVNLYFKDRDESSKQGNATTTMYDEVYWGYCIALYQHGRYLDFPDSPDRLSKIILGDINIGADMTLGKINKIFNDGHPNLKNFKGYVDGSMLFCNTLLEKDTPYYIFRENICINLTGDNRNLNGPNKSLHSLIKKFGRDKWNPSDIYICKASEYDIIKRELESLIGPPKSSIENINSYLLDNLWVEDTHKIKFSGVSFKDILNEPHIEEQNMDVLSMTPEELENKKRALGENLEIKKISIPQMTLFPNGQDRGGLEFSIKLDSNEYKVAFRRFGGDSMSLDVTPLKSGGHLGKVDKGSVLRDILYKENGIPEKVSAAKTINSWFDKDSIEQMEKFIEDILEYGLEFNRELSIERFWGLSNDIKSLGRENIKKEHKSEEERTIYNKALEWPRIIDFLHILRPGRRDDILRTFVLAAQKVGQDQAPHIKLS